MEWKVTGRVDDDEEEGNRYGCARSEVRKRVANKTVFTEKRESVRMVRFRITEVTSRVYDGRGPSERLLETRSSVFVPMSPWSSP